MVFLWELRDDFKRPVQKCGGGPKEHVECCRHFCNLCREFLQGVEKVPSVALHENEAEP